jgi:putative tryptophan/tyrosine transport system substrate-binding protein
MKATLLFIAFFLCLFGCKPKEEKIIAVLKYVTHPALDELEVSFENKLDSLIKTNPNLNNYKIVKYNANGNQQSAKSIAESFNYKNVKLIIAIATPSAIAISNTKSDIPFLYGAVADPVGAKIIPSKRATGIQNSGEIIISKALEFMRVAFPNAKRLGTLYNQGEQNSIFVQNIIKKLSPQYGFELKQITINGNAQLASISEYLCNNVDLIYSANDNTVNAGITSITSVSNKMKIPFVIGDLSTLNKGPLFAVGLSYKKMGKDLALMAYEILCGKTISDFPPKPAPEPEIWLNKTSMGILGYSITDSIVYKMIDKTINN